MPLDARHVSQFTNVSIVQVMHARSGGSIEVMGVMQGRVDKDTFIIMDSFQLPVEATEVRVNAGAEAYEYMAQFLGLGEAVRLAAS